MDNLFHLFISSIIQGITEWMPVSSSGHLALFGNIFGELDLKYGVFLHFSSILAVLFVFRKDVLELLDIRKKSNLNYLLLIIVASIPAIIFGFFLRDFVQKSFFSLFSLGLFFIISGLIVYFTKFAKPRLKNISFFNSIVIGLFQAIAIFPGISRSGATISGSLYSGINRKEGVKFSFFLAIIIIFGASFLELNDLNFGNISYFGIIFSFMITFLTSIFTIKFLIKVINREKFYLFGIYNFLLGIIILLYNFFF